jgi:hypothetical protein
MKINENALRKVVSRIVIRKLNENNEVMKELDRKNKVNQAMASMNKAINSLQSDILKVLGIDKAEELSPEQVKVISQTLKDIESSNEKIIDNALKILLSIEVQKEKEAGQSSSPTSSGAQVKISPNIDVSKMPTPDTSGIPNITEKRKK